ncbi:hypothetical protein [Methyloferula stellata]|uniref:hypothetical protein n=1 Tax=Methyloferula stellata TaxID=876270 RepID=UPI0003721808|nr:hypothetical protein [Methyloferula stellata]
MAEYYPLLAKAVSGLPDSTPAMRHAVYERARKALLGQLRALQPPVPEADIEKESQALDVAVARLEAEYAAAPVPDEVKEAPLASPPAGQAPAPPATQAPPPLRPAEPRQVPSAPPPSMPIRPRIAKVAPAPPPAGFDEAKKDEPAEEPKDRAFAAANTSSFPQAGAQGPIPGVAKIRPERQRPIAPQAPSVKPNSKGLWIVLVVIGLIVAGVAATAWKLRDKPEDLAKLKTIQAQQTETSGKIVGRVGDSEQSKAAAPAAGSAAQSATDTNVPVTYRAALLVQAPEEQNKVKTYFGTVIWRLDNVSNGPGEPLGTAIHANIDIPEDKLQIAMTLQKNIDASLPATHTMTIVFTIQPSTPTGAVKQIGLPQLRKEDTPNGEALSGLPVPIMENSFLIGLAKGTSEANNLDLLKTRQWIDIPIQLANGRIAKLTFEKGVAGQRAIDDAITSWQAQ